MEKMRKKLEEGNMKAYDLSGCKVERKRYII